MIDSFTYMEHLFRDWLRGARQEEIGRLLVSSARNSASGALR